MNNQMFGVVISNAQPKGVKISKKNTCLVELVIDDQAKKKTEALQQLLNKINKEEEIPWKQQFTNACLLHPTKNEDGEIEDVSAGDAVLHFFSIGWKFIFSTIPPAHYAGGYASFFTCLVVIGMVVVMVSEIAEMMGCSIGIKLGVTAITFVAIGTSLPDTFASKIAA